MARAVTAPELALLRSDNQRSILKVCIVKPSQVMTATIAAAPTKNDEVTEVSITVTSGSAAAVANGMTVLVGTAAGAYDIGIIRARSATAAVLKIGSTSDIAWTVGLHITVLDDYQIWARPLRYSDGLWNIEGEEAYTNQHSAMSPVPVLGPAVAVVPLSAGTATFSPTAAASWVPGSTISGYTWTAVGASATAGLTTATPTLTYNAPGLYRITCTVTAANGATATGYRYVYVPGVGAEPALNFGIEKITGDLQSGGWQFAVTMYDATEIAGIRPRTMVVLYAEDYYGDTLHSLGPIGGYENVVAVGWIDGATIDWNPEVGLVRYTVKGAAEWMQKAASWPVSLLDTTTTPGDWMHIQNLTVDKALWHMVSWRSTIAKTMDVYPSGDGRRAFDCSGNLGSIWEQLKAFAVKIGADPACDRYGRLFLETDLQYVKVADRAAIPVVMAITKADWQGTVNIQRRDFRQTALVEVAGFSWNGSKWGASLARAPGNAMSGTGAMNSRYNWLFTDQTQANEIAEYVFAKENNPYPVIPITLAANNRMIDICPRQYLTLTVAAVDTPLGLVWTDAVIICRRLEMAWDRESGALTTEIECELATSPVSPSVAVIPPSVPTPNLPPLPNFSDYGYPITPGLYGPPGTYLPPELPPDNTCYTDTAAAANGPYDIGVYGTKTNIQPISHSFDFFVRSSAHVNKTKYEVRGRFQKWNVLTSIWEDTTDDDFYSIRAVPHVGNQIAGIKDPVDNPRIRSGLLVGGAASALCYAINLVWAGTQATFWPDVFSFGPLSDATGGVMTHWKKGQGTRVHIEGVQHVSGGPPVYDTAHKFGITIGFTDVSIQPQGKPLYMHVASAIARDTIWARLSTGIEGAMINNENPYYPADSSAYFGEFVYPVGMPSGRDITIRLTTAENFNITNTYGMDIEIQPHPTYRIIIDGIYLYNICPPVAWP